MIVRRNPTKIHNLSFEQWKKQQQYDAMQVTVQKFVELLVVFTTTHTMIFVHSNQNNNNNNNIRLARAEVVLAIGSGLTSL
jgi:hypothetical protein